MINERLLQFKKSIHSRSVISKRKPDKQTRKLLFYLFTSTRGGFTRLRIIMCLLAKSYNTHQLAEQLDLDYKAVQHHVKVLEKNNMISKVGGKYGALFYISDFLELNICALEEAIDKLDRKINREKIYF